MRATKDEPILTRTYEHASSFVPLEKSIYVYGKSSEERSSHVDNWADKAVSTRFLRIENESQSQFSDQDNISYLLRSEDSLRRFWGDTSGNPHIYLDVTGLTHPVWASILKSALSMRLGVSVVYVEPGKYSRSAAPLEGQIYDLSSRISGVAPLPGFAVLGRQSANEFLFVPLLGFEGTRLRHLIEQVQPGANRIYPVVGSPGFKPWYVFETFLGNKAALSETAAWQSVRYAPGNCPFSCFYLLQELALNNPMSALKIAPIGTKPHAIGAVLFALSTSSDVELVYDHPIRTTGRSDGIDRLLEYSISGFIAIRPEAETRDTHRPRKRRMRND